MSLTPGTRLGPYEIVSPLGAGGMGEVYKARDTRLARTVAIKVLPADSATDAAARARFEREARAIAALSHPHICVVHDVGHQDPSTGSGTGIDYLVMELLEGETLAERLARAKGPLPLDEVLRIGVAIADALDKAHRAGIVHRDLKPLNVMLTKSGPKLLDFGLAKLHGAVSPVSLSNETAATTVGPGTAKGTILGTIHYMAPEQVEGRDADTRTDIWALGALLYEMATGQRPFEGESAASVIGAIMQGTPVALSTRQPLTPPAFEHLVERCLAKDPGERWQSVGDLAWQLQWLASARQRSESSSPAAGPVRRTVVAAAALGGSFLVAALWLAVSWAGRGASVTPPPLRSTMAIVAPDKVRMLGGSSLSPDGRNFVYVGLGPDTAPSLWLYSIETGVSRELPGTSDASYPFWSPRGDALGFFAGGQLKVVTLSGAAPRVLAPASSGRGGAWGADGVILYAPASNGALYRVSEQGGSPVLALPVDPAQGGVGLRFPVLVDPDHFLYEAQSTASKTGIYLWSSDTQSSTHLVSTYSNTAFVDGRLFYVENGMLVSRALDVQRARFSSEPVDVAGPVATASGLGSGFAAFSLSRTGLLTYASGSIGSASIAPRWFDRQGRPAGDFLTGMEVIRHALYGMRMSPDGRRVAFNAIAVSTSDVWVADVERNIATLVTTNDANDQYTVWSPDGSEIIIGSNRTGFYNMYRKSASGTDVERPIAPATSNQYATDWSKDGRVIVFTNLDPQTQVDLWTMQADGSGAPTPFLDSRANEVGGRLSPDGRWMAYVSDESGRFEVYAQRFPDGGDKTQISTQGGSEPQWRADGRELFYVGANRTLMVVPLQGGSALGPGRPTKLFDALVDTTLGSFGQSHFTISPDGQRFLVSTSPDNTPPMMLVQNWNAPVFK